MATGNPSWKAALRCGPAIFRRSLRSDAASLATKGKRSFFLFLAAVSLSACYRGVGGVAKIISEHDRSQSRSLSGGNLKERNNKLHIVPVQRFPLTF
jgi:hypothetical protein